MKATDKELVERLTNLANDAEIRRVMTDYAALVDARQWGRLEHVFTEDAFVDYHNGRTQVVGARKIVDYIRENTAHLAWQHHLVSPYAVDIDGDEAVGSAYLISHQMVADDPSNVLSMAATYECSFRRTDRWQMSRMVHRINVANFIPISTSPAGNVDIPPAVRH